MQRGFSLVETIIATGLIVAALVTLAHLLAIAGQAGASARIRTASALLAGRKMEELRARTWEAVLGDGRGSVEYFDGQGSRVCGDAPMPCGPAAYVCRWSAGPAAFNANVLVIEVDVAAIATRAGSTTLVSARSRKR